MALIDDVRTALRITHVYLDSLLTKQIAMARAEMIRNGMSSAVVNDENNILITDAIITFCQMKNADTITESEQYTASWKFQLDCLRKSNLPEPDPEPEPEPEPSGDGQEEEQEETPEEGGDDV